MTCTHRSAELLGLAEEVRERTAMKYAGDCKCGKCQLLPRSLVERIYHTLNSLAAKPDEDGVLLQLAEWCRIEREKLGAIDGYDYRSGEEFGLRRAQNEIEGRALSTMATPKP